MGLPTTEKAATKNLQLSLDTSKHIPDTWAVLWYSRPTKFQRVPNVIHELYHPVLSLGSLRALALEYLPGNDIVRVLVKWFVPAENLADHHPKSVTIRTFRPSMDLNFRVKKLWAHPSDRTASRE